MTTQAATDQGPEDPVTHAKKPWWWRTLKWLGLALLAIFLLVLAYIIYLWWRVPQMELNAMTPGDLSVAEGVSESVT
ncbi:MAG: hypothetical protein K0U64_05780, partial [Actinomycetia bacterium]|nr:hypothetical protein [Actinomycetes bacterium]